MTNLAHHLAAVDVREPADTVSDGQVIPGPVTIVPIRNGKRTIGAYVVSQDSARFEPATDVTPIAMTALGVAAVIAVSVAVATAARQLPAIRSVTMGPGGWVSLKGTAMPPLRSAAASTRPWWARALGARRLVVQR
jgi:hypothetical protein